MTRRNLPSDIFVSFAASCLRVQTVAANDPAFPGYNRSMPTTAHLDFTPTRWTLVLAAARHHHTPSDAPRAALEQLARAYAYPLYAYVRRRGHSPADAEDLTQSFFAHLLEHETLAAADKAKGRFRAFLLTAFKHFLINAHHQDHAAKRRPAKLLPLDAETRYAHDTRFASNIPADTLTPDRLFDRRWALQLLDSALDDLAADYAARNDTALFLALKPTLTAPDDAPTYAAIAASLHLSENALKTAAHRLRRRYRDALRARIAATVDTPEQIDDEIRHLFDSL
jgi:RNA polymerase sigma-70 factor (ECF subfamily)